MSDTENNDDDGEAEEQMRANALAIEACVLEHAGLTWDEYHAGVRGDARLSLSKPPLPAGTIDAADFCKAVDDSARVLGGCRAQIEALRERIAGTHKVESILSAGNSAIAAAFGNSGQRRQALQQECERLEAEEAAHVDALSCFVHGLRVIDGSRLQAELAPLLRRRLELALAHKRRAAERILLARR